MALTKVLVPDMTTGNYPLSRINNTPICVLDYGAVGNDSTPCDTPVANALAAALASGRPLYFPAGTYRFTSAATTVWDFNSVRLVGQTIFGDGLGRTILNFPNVINAIALQMLAASDWYDLTVRDLTIIAATEGPTVVVGRNDFSDPLNTACFFNVGIFNTLNNALAEALRLNYVVNSNFIGCRANCYADGLGTNVGTALRARQVEFCTFTNGSYGNAEYGVRFTDAFSFGNVFVGTDHENVGYCVSTDSSSSGNNTFIGGQFSLWTQAAFKTTGSLSTNAITVINANYSNGTSPAPVIDPAFFALIRKIDGTGIVTPAYPSSGATTLNKTGKKVLVVVWGGTLASVTVGSVSVAFATGSVVVEHGQSITLNYSVSGSWLWQPLE